MYREKGKRIIKYASILAEKLKTKEKTEKEIILENLKEAREEWRDKERYFQSVTEADLVDHAIYELEASRIKYIYLLKKIREGDIE